MYDAFTYLKPSKDPVHFVAHEFFDALPCFKFKVQDGLWREKLIRLENLVFQDEKV